MTAATPRDRYLPRPLNGLAAAGLTALLAAALALAPAAAAQEAEQSEGDGAVQMVRETTDEMIELIEQGKAYAEEDPERFYREVEALLDPVVDFESFARSVMAVHYKSATPEQQQRFAETFKWGLVRTYALALTEFEDGEVVVVPPDRPPRNPRRQTVKMEIRTGSGEVYPVLYSVTQNDEGEWQVRNLIVNGVNMGLTYRNQFNSAMRDPEYGGDIDKVIDDWGEILEEEEPPIQAPEGEGEGQGEGRTEGGSEGPAEAPAEAAS